MFDGINKWLDGKKTIIAGFGAVGAFLVVLAGALQDGIQTSDLQPVLISFATAMAIFGFGGKLQKLIDVLKKND